MPLPPNENEVTITKTIQFCHECPHSHESGGLAGEATMCGHPDAPKAIRGFDLHRIPNECPLL